MQSSYFIIIKIRFLFLFWDAYGVLSCDKFWRHSRAQYEQRRKRTNIFEQHERYDVICIDVRSKENVFLSYVVFTCRYIDACPSQRKIDLVIICLVVRYVRACDLCWYYLFSNIKIYIYYVSRVLKSLTAVYCMVLTRHIFNMTSSLYDWRYLVVNHFRTEFIWSCFSL